MMYPSPVSALCTQASMESLSYEKWCRELGEAPSFHRKQWEYCYILDMLSQLGKLKEGQVGLGFGCGKERLVAALAAHQTKLLVTDLELEQAKENGWVHTNQHSQGVADFYQYVPGVCSMRDLDRVQYRTVDMNAIPLDLMQMGFDFCWSSCSLEHLGSLENAKRFIYSTVHCLKPGGVAVHTTEYNISSNDKTLESGPTVLFRRKDLEEVERELNKIDATLLPLDLNPGNKQLDCYVDLPPYLGNEQRKHLKLAIDGYTCTSVGLVVRRKL